MYEPLKIFTYIGLTVFGAGSIGALRFLYYWFASEGAPVGHIQSLIFSAVLMIVGFQVLLIGLLADVISANRKLLEDLVYRVRTLELPPRGSEPVATGARDRDAAAAPDAGRWEH